MRPRWTKSQAAVLALLERGRRLRHRDTHFVLEDVVTVADNAVSISSNTLMQLFRAGAINFVRERGNAYAVLNRAPASRPALLGGKDAAAGANLEDEHS